MRVIGTLDLIDNEDRELSSKKGTVCEKIIGILRSNPEIASVNVDPKEACGPSTAAAVGGGAQSGRDRRARRRAGGRDRRRDRDLAKFHFKSNDEDAENFGLCCRSLVLRR